MKLSNIKILWLTDYTVREVPAGGAEITDSWILKAARISGYSVDVCRPVELKSNNLEEADLVIFSNNYEFPKAARDRIMETKPYIVYSHDSGRWMDVFKTHPDMCKNAVGTIFLSPLHQKSLEKFLTGAKNVVCVPPHIPLEFHDKGQSRENKIMFVGNIHDGKGIPEVMKFAKEHPGIHLDFYYQRGQNHFIAELKRIRNCHMVGYVPREVIYENYNRYKYFIHIPRHSESFGRAVGEAYLSGCQLIVNQKVGACSYNWDYRTFREMTANAHFLFWEQVEKMIK